MKIKASLKCPGCDSSTKVTFQQPGFMAKRIVLFACSVCFSDVQAMVKRNPKEKVGLLVQSSVRIPSDCLIAMKKEEAKGFTPGEEK